MTEGVSDKRATGWQAGQRAVIGRQRIVTIERVTPSGRAVADGRTFEADGMERSSAKTFRRNRLEPITPEIEAEMALVARGRQASRDASDAVEEANRWLRKNFDSWNGRIPEAADVDTAEKMTAAIKGAINNAQ